MKFDPLPISGCFRIELEPIGDQRGSFARFFCAETFAKQGLVHQWAQCNFSVTRQTGSICGMHFQHSKAAEIKLIRCVAGAAFDVLVDMRKGSKTFGKTASVEISPDNHTMVYAAAGCAHGFQTLRPDTQMVYFHSANYGPDHEGGVHYADPDLAIDWPLEIADVSPKDNSLKSLKETEPFQ